MGKNAKSSGRRDAIKLRHCDLVPLRLRDQFFFILCHKSGAKKAEDLHTLPCFVESNQDVHDIVSLLLCARRVSWCRNLALPRTDVPTKIVYGVPARGDSGSAMDWNRTKRIMLRSAQLNSGISP